MNYFRQMHQFPEHPYLNGGFMTDRQKLKHHDVVHAAFPFPRLAFISTSESSFNVSTFKSSICSISELTSTVPDDANAMNAKKTNTMMKRILKFFLV